MAAVDISIIIATRNRESILWLSVKKAVAAIEGIPAEIIIVNDGDQPLQMPFELKDKITCHNNPIKGVSSARNYGVLKSAGNVLFFVDDDMWVNQKAVQWIINQMDDDANIRNVYNLNWEYPETLNSKLTGTKVGKYLLSAQYNTMWGRMHAKGTKPTEGLYKFHQIASCSLVMHKNIFNALNGYNKSLIFQGEDIDLTIRLNKNAIPILCVFDVTLHHNHADRLDLNGYLQRDVNGFRYQFMAEKAGLIPSSPHHYHKPAMYVFEFFRVTEKGWIALYNLIPGNNFFIPLTNKLTGLLSGLQRYKQWWDIIGKAQQPL